LERAVRLEQLGIDTEGARHDDPDGVRWRLYFDDPGSQAAVDHARRIKRAETRMSGDVIARWFPPGPHADVDIRPLLPAVRCPTLVAVGAHDILCGPVWARPIVAGVPHADLITFERSGHVPQYEQPDEFRTAVLDWYARVRARSWHDHATAATGHPACRGGANGRSN
jgi:pimeloyl-ACP methyl ester carboxylesterase